MTRIWCRGRAWRIISGGREESAIPDSCVLTIERRTQPGESAEDLERDIAGPLAKPPHRRRGSLPW
jgi:acetylornithine deacetylase/succinyl-diaminopimelate desuccinylase-like protein